MTDGFESKTSLHIDRIIKKAGGIDPKWTMRPDGNYSLEFAESLMDARDRVTRVAAAFDFQPNTTEHLVFVISAAPPSGDMAIKTILRCVNGIA
jgi:hypothetical protein